MASLIDKKSPAVSCEALICVSYDGLVNVSHNTIDVVVTT